MPDDSLQFLASWLPDYFFGDFASIVAAVVGSVAGVTLTVIPVARSCNVFGSPFTVILVAGVTLYSFDADGEWTLTVMEARWTALNLSLVSTAAGVLFLLLLFFSYAIPGTAGKSSVTERKIAKGNSFFMGWFFEMLSESNRRINPGGRQFGDHPPSPERLRRDKQDATAACLHKTTPINSSCIISGFRPPQHAVFAEEATIEEIWDRQFN